MNESINRDGNRRVEGKRLVYYNKNADRNHWEALWQEEMVSPQYFAQFLRGELKYFDRPFKRHLPESGIILEAGCGIGQWVVALRSRGYNCVGLDYVHESLERTNHVVGPLPFIASDVMALGLAEASFDAVISLGVVEHWREGPQALLREMRRILKPGGVLLVSVPYFQIFRQWRAQHGAYRDDVDGLDFYQYAFSKEEFVEILQELMFDVEAVYSYSQRKTLAEEFKWLKSLHPFLVKAIYKLSDSIPFINSEFGHMLMVVARKPM